jgi:hypothetical protein
MNNTTTDGEEEEEERVNSTLLSLPSLLNIYLGLFLWLTGNLGSVGNMIVFRRRIFKDRAYSIYLFWTSITHFFYFNFVLSTRILQKGFRIAVINRFIVVCKLRQFSTVWGNVLAFSLFTLATVDRLLSAQRSIGQSSFLRSTRDERGEIDVSL